MSAAAPRWRLADVGELARRHRLVVGIGAAVVLLLAVLVLAVRGGGGDPLSAAADKCGIGEVATTTGELALSTGPGAPYTAADSACLFAELDAPFSVPVAMDATRADDGKRTAVWGDYRIRWSRTFGGRFDITITRR